MNDEWIKVASLGNGWAGEDIYVNPKTEKAKVFSHKITYWSHHDESEIEEEEYLTSIENALALVYPDEKAISIILNNTKKDYCDVLKRLSELQVQKT